MNIDLNDRKMAVVSDGDMRVTFKKHEYLPQFVVSIDLGPGNGNAAGLKFVRDAFTWAFNETPCIMLYGSTSKSQPEARNFILNIPAEQYKESPDEWFFRIGIEEWAATTPGADKARAKKWRDWQ